MLQTFAFYLDRALPLPELTRTVASVLNIPSADVRAIDQDAFEREPWPWFSDDVSVGLQAASIEGDFPQEVTVISRLPLDKPQTIGALANSLRSTILTDAFGVNPIIVSAWTMVLPSGEVQSVYIDAEAFSTDDPAIILLPDYRRDYDEMHRRAVV